MSEPMSHLEVPVKYGDYVNISRRPNGSTQISVEPQTNSSARIPGWKFSGTIQKAGVLQVGPDGLPRLKRARVDDDDSTKNDGNNSDSDTTQVNDDPDDEVENDDTVEPDADSVHGPSVGNFVLLSYDAEGIRTGGNQDPEFDETASDEEYVPRDEMLGVFWCQEVPENTEEGSLGGFWLQDKVEWDSQTTKWYKSICAPAPLPTNAFVDSYAEAPLSDYEGTVSYTASKLQLQWTSERNRLKTYPVPGQLNRMLPSYASKGSALDPIVTWPMIRQIAKAQVKAFAAGTGGSKRDKLVRDATPLKNAAAILALYNELS